MVCGLLGNQQSGGRVAREVPAAGRKLVKAAGRAWCKLVSAVTSPCCQGYRGSGRSCIHEICNIELSKHSVVKCCLMRCVCPQSCVRDG